MDHTARHDRMQALYENSVAFRRLYDAHQKLDEKVQKIEKIQHLNSDLHFEQQRLKKLKLRQKEKIEQIIADYDQGTQR